MATKLAIDPELLERAVGLSVAQLGIRRELVLLITGNDFGLAAKHSKLKIRTPKARRRGE